MIDLVVAYSMQNNVYYFTRVATVIAHLKRASNGVLEHTCGLLCVYRETLVSVWILYNALFEAISWSSFSICCSKRKQVIPKTAFNFNNVVRL